jgi:subtilisin family serine protease
MRLVAAIRSAVMVIFFCPALAVAQEVIPNDPFFPRQITFRAPGGAQTFDQYSWRATPVSLNSIAGVDLNITSAWAISTGSSSVVVALLDDGFPYWHEDLVDNIWRNPGETGLDANGYSKESNGVDDDSNGYTDDVYGYDFAFSDPDPDPYIFDGRFDDRVAVYTHSCPAMGIIGAKGNNGIGIAGINWSVSMMLLKIGAQGSSAGPDGMNRVKWAAEAIHYAVDNGARAINWSGFVQPDRRDQVAILEEAIGYAESRGVLLITCAGNYKLDLDLPENSTFPASFLNDNIIVVAEVDLDGSLYVVPEGSRYVGGSNYGSRSVDIAAFAQNYTTLTVRERVSAYHLTGGTSNATPVVTGLAALIWSVRPDLSGFEVKQILMQSARRLPALAGKTVSGGMVDARAALELACKFRPSDPGMETARDILHTAPDQPSPTNSRSLSHAPRL